MNPNPYNRNRVSELMFMMPRKISSSFAFGRKCFPCEIEKNFILEFFIQCSDSQIKYLNSLVKDEGNEVLLIFYKDMHRLTVENMNNFDFQNHTWTAFCSTGWDDIRMVSQPTLTIELHEK